MNKELYILSTYEQDLGHHQQYHRHPRRGPSRARRREKRAADHKQAADKANAEVSPEENVSLKLAEEAEVHTRTEQSREDTAQVDKATSDSGHENSDAQKDLVKDLTVADEICPDEEYSTTQKSDNFSFQCPRHLSTAEIQINLQT